ncbi:amino acid ABC transporter permease protein, His/Glu/Gln/Arg/opine [Crocosphaera subtropica ATCC 51142]|uniref:Amino acid ABC transporter permease protein, His/Glu/Gln/Arg/opine n=1 Tax=Crocosphaera subtropica (strain ATCC 51142 / BH68) TaxID=43989 RepID=B1WRN2_CROS5|nr:amino acid ABC transporter permease [Crocosphaera subtropica]ACB53473.1 amino acid ABC transporter permease protein, His/Glu/Gln/Arg/opine [Crocosphaera subtropica ATCC 51142]
MSRVISNPLSPVAWIKKNLFNSWFNSLLTIISLIFIYWVSSGLINWAFFQAQWGVLSANLRLFFVGQYPANLLWRAWTSLAIIISLVGLSWGTLSPKNNFFNPVKLTLLGLIALLSVLLAIPISLISSAMLLAILFLFIIFVVLGQQISQTFPNFKNWLSLLWFITFFLLLGLLQGAFFLRDVRLDDFSGLILTIFVAVISIVLSFPFGILLALGRQSNLPVIRWLSIGYIELIRGLPLIGILFMAQVMLPLILPQEMRIQRVVRAIAGFTLFSAAYLAENVRGGLQSVPKGQIEAAKAVGLNGFFVLILVVLPQALRVVIPTIVGQFISLFKDTSLLAIVGLVDLLGISQSILANPKFIGTYGEVYLFVAAIYWIFCYSMSLLSRKLEKT